MGKILVTGGAGFIGSHVIDRLLQDGYEVLNIDNFNDFYDQKTKESNITSHLKFKDTYSLIREDITKKDFLYSSLKKHNIDTIIHLAARAGVRPSIEYPNQYYLDNVIGTQNILDYAKDNNVKNLILASSSSIYGNNKKVPFSESDPVDNPISPYAVTKKTNELQAYTYHHLFGLKIMMLRFFTVYGPRQRPDLAIHKFSNLIKHGKPIPFYGNGNTLRDYTFIDDIIQGIIKSMNYLKANSKVYEVINIGNNKPVSLLDMVRTIEFELKIKAILINLPIQPGDVNITFADISKAEKLIDYKVNTPFKTGIYMFIKWFNTINL